MTDTGPTRPLPDEVRSALRKLGAAPEYARECDVLQREIEALVEEKHALESKDPLTAMLVRNTTLHAQNLLMLMTLRKPVVERALIAEAAREERARLEAQAALEERAHRKELWTSRTGLEMVTAGGLIAVAAIKGLPAIISAFIAAFSSG